MNIYAWIMLFIVTIFLVTMVWQAIDEGFDNSEGPVFLLGLVVFTSPIPLIGRVLGWW